MTYQQIIGYLGALGMLIAIVLFFIPIEKIKIGTKICILIIGALLILLAIKEDTYTTARNMNVTSAPQSQTATISASPTITSTPIYIPADMTTFNSTKQMVLETPVKPASEPTIGAISDPTSEPIPDLTATLAAYQTNQATISPTQSSATPHIMASTDNRITYNEEGLYLFDDIGERMTFTCRQVLVPDKAWNEELSKSESKTIASQWVDVILVLPEDMNAVIFSGGIQQAKKSYTEGVLVMLDKSGSYSFRILNGEIVIWYPNQDENQYTDLLRILNQVASGNNDTKRRLKLQAISSNLLSSIPNIYINKDLLSDITIPIASD